MISSTGHEHLSPRSDHRDCHVRRSGPRAHVHQAVRLRRQHARDLDVAVDRAARPRRGRVCPCARLALGRAAPSCNGTRSVAALPGLGDDVRGILAGARGAVGGVVCVRRHVGFGCVCLARERRRTRELCLRSVRGREWLSGGPASHRSARAGGDHDRARPDQLRLGGDAGRAPASRRGGDQRDRGGSPGVARRRASRRPARRTPAGRCCAPILTPRSR